MTQAFGKIYDYRRSDSWAKSIRNQRINFFKSLVNSLPIPIKILDIGGRVSFWESTGFLNKENKNIEITILNISAAEIGSTHPKIKQIIGDARNLAQFAVNEFDVVFSNSVIEHVGNYGEQSCMANELMRVGKRYFIQTPNRYFLVEPHFVFPLFQFLPIWLRAWLLTHFSLGWYNKTSDYQKARELVTEIRLLNHREFINLFPGAKLYEEKIFGFTKSFVAYYGW